MFPLLILILFNYILFVPISLARGLSILLTFLKNEHFFVFLFSVYLAYAIFTSGLSLVTLDLIRNLSSSFIRSLFQDI